MIFTNIYLKNINNKIVFIMKNVVFLTIFFSMVFYEFQMLPSSISLMILLVPKIKFNRYSDEGGKLHVDDSSSEEASDSFVESSDIDDNALKNMDMDDEEPEDTQGGIVERIKAVATTGKKIKVIGIVTGIVLFFVVLIAALTIITDPITQLTNLVLTEAGFVFDDSNNSSGGGKSWIIGVVEDFLEKAKNMLFLGEYALMEEIVENKLNDFSMQFYEKYHVKIDVGLLMATIYYDGSVEDEIDTNNDGKPDQNPKLLERIKYLENPDNFDKIASLALTVREAKYICREEITPDGPTYITEFVSSQEVDTLKENKTCGSSTITKDLNNPDDYIYTYDWEYNKSNYFNKIVDSEVLTAFFPDANTKEKKEQIASEMKRSYSIWFMFYGKDDEGVTCVAPGNISNKLLGYMRNPVSYPYRITSKYGPRNDPFTKTTAIHNGIDIVPNGDSKIYAAATGTVYSISYNEEEGNNIVLAHTIDGQVYYTAYKHLANNSIIVKEKQDVGIGDYIATMGATGKVTGAHLHFSMYTISADGKKNYFNPENLFSTAENYEYECSNAVEVGTCSIEGAIAVYAFKKMYSFNLLRAIYRTESSYYTGNLNLTIDLDIEGLKKLLDSSNSSQAKKVKELIRFDSRQVLYGDFWLPFSDKVRDQAAIHRVVSLVASISDKAYEYVYMGMYSLKGSNYKKYGYNSAKEMYDTFSSNRLEQLKWTFEEVVADNYYLHNILQTFDAEPEYIVRAGDTQSSIAKMLFISENELVNSTNIKEISLTPGQGLKIKNKQIVINLLLRLMIKDIENRDGYINKVYSNYYEYANDPDSTIEKHLNECLMTEKPGWADCSTYESKRDCEANIRAYKAKATELVNKAPTAIGKRVLLNALSLWGKVRYCSACSTSNPECTDFITEGGVTRPGNLASFYTYKVRCPSPGAVNTWNREGFNKYWSVIHKYTYPGTAALDANGKPTYVGGGTFEAAVAGLDCTGFATWVLAQTFQIFPWPYKNYTLRETDYMIGTRFKEIIPDYKTFADVAPLLKPGDFVKKGINANGITHIMIYMGYDDFNGNGIPDGEETVYFIHTGNGRVGVEILAKKLTWDGFEEYKSFGTFK